LAHSPAFKKTRKLVCLSVDMLKYHRRAYFAYAIPERDTILIGTLIIIILSVFQDVTKVHTLTNVSCLAYQLRRWVLKEWINISHNVDVTRWQFENVLFISKHSLRTDTQLRFSLHITPLGIRFPRCDT